MNAFLRKLIYTSLFLFAYSYGQIDTLNFDTAMYRTIQYSHLLKIAQLDAAAKREVVKQVSYLPNPEVEYEVKQFGGNRTWKGWKNREEEYEIFQLIETANKRGIRTKAALYQYYAATMGYEVSKWSNLNQLTKAFINAVAAQTLLDLANQEKSLSEQELFLLKERVKEGKLPPTQQYRAEVIHTNLELDAERALVNWETSKDQLAVLWGSTCPDFQTVDYPFYDLSPPIPLEEILADLCNQPEIVKSVYDQDAAKQLLQLEKAGQVPDVIVRFGYKIDYESQHRGLIAGVAMPLPIFNQNQGNIGRACNEWLKTNQEGEQLWLVLQSKLTIAYKELLLAYQQAIRLRDRLLVPALRAFELAQEGFLERKIDYSDLLDIQRNLFDAQESYIKAIVNYHHLKADIEYITSEAD